MTSDFEATRRHLLAGGLAATTFATAASPAGADQKRPATFVLVHGSWHGGWCYARVAAILRKKGHRVFTPTLTGLADRAHLLSPAINLDTHITDVVSLIDYYDITDVVLCGHSYGGIPVMGVADRRSDKIASLFMLDAFVPNDGQSLIDVARQPVPTTLTQPSPPASKFVATEKDWPWVQSKLTPHPNGSRTQKIALTGAWTAIPKKTYVRVVDNKSPVFDSMKQKFARDPTWRTADLTQSGHDAMVDQPAVLAAMLEVSLV